MHNYEKIVFGASNKKDIEAIKDYSYAISVESKLPQAFMERGVRYSKIGKHKEAIIDLSITIQKRKKLYYPRCFLERGKTFLKIKNYKKAYLDFSKMLKLNNLSEEGREKAYMYRSISKIFLKKPKVTSKLKLITDDLLYIWEMYDPNERHYLLGLMFSLNKRYETAIRYFKDIISEDPLFFKKYIDYYDLLPLEIKLLFKTELHL